MAAILGSECVENDLRSMEAEVREIHVSSTTHKTCSKLTRDFFLVYCTSRQKLHFFALVISQEKSRSNNLDFDYFMIYIFIVSGVYIKLNRQILWL